MLRLYAPTECCRENIATQIEPQPRTTGHNVSRRWAAITALENPLPLIMLEPRPLVCYVHDELSRRTLHTRRHSHDRIRITVLNCILEEIQEYLTEQCGRSRDDILSSLVRQLNSHIPRVRQFLKKLCRLNNYFRQRRFRADLPKTFSASCSRKLRQVRKVPHKLYSVGQLCTDSAETLLPSRLRYCAIN